MLKRLTIITTLALLVTLTAVASDREDDIKRTDKAAEVFTEIMHTPDKGIPHGTTGIGEMYRHHSRGREIRLHIRR